MAKRKISGNADERPRIWLDQCLRAGRMVGRWRRHPAAAGHVELTVPLALQAALASIDMQPAVIVWEGVERIEL
jgi:hypothetical protein